MPEIKLHMVWRWTCPACKQVNHEDPPTMAVTEEDRIMQPELYEGDVALVPTVVLCPACLECADVAEDDDQPAPGDL